MRGPLAGALPMARLEFAQALFSVRSIVFVVLFLLLLGAAGVFGVTALFLSPSSAAGGFAAATGLFIAAMVLIVLLVGPAMAVFSSSDAIVAERSARTLDALLSRPVTRRGVALGKFLGRGAHLGLVAVVGLLIGAVIFAARVPLEADKVAYFLAVTVLLFLIYAALALLLSSVSRTPGTATALAVAVWLTFYILWGFVVEGLKRVGAEGAAAWLNPNTLFMGALRAAFPAPAEFAGLPAGMTPGAAVLGLLAYLGIVLALAVEVFHRQDEAGN